jgi:hypothetical protein
MFLITEDNMKKKTGVITVGLLLASGLAFAEKVDDKKDLHKARENIRQAMNEMDRARAANEYDMDGHGAKAEQLLKDAEAEIKLATEAVRKDKTVK